jgi:hypothetical protein
MRLICLLLFLFAAFPAPAAPPLLDAAAVPGLDATARAAYERFLRQNHPRAFAIDGNGRWGSAWGQASADAAAEAAIGNCRRTAPAADCRVFVRNNDIVWPGRAWSPPPPPGRIAGGVAFEVLPDPRFLWWGVRDAAGAYIWAHGRAVGQDSRGQQPQPHVRWFNNAGWDVFRFDRHPNSDDPDRAAGWLRESILALRGAGYTRVVVGGQSRGGWNALMMLAIPGLADAVIAIAPARHGDGAISNPNYPRATDDFRDLLTMAADPRARVAIAGFRGDNFVPDPDARSVLVRQLLPARSAHLLWIDRPDGFDGHSAGATWRFSDAFGGCLLRFVTLPTPPVAC